MRRSVSHLPDRLLDDSTALRFPPASPVSSAAGRFEFSEPTTAVGRLSASHGLPVVPFESRRRATGASGIRKSIRTPRQREVAFPP